MEKGEGQGQPPASDRRRGSSSSLTFFMTSFFSFSSIPLRPSVMAWKRSLDLKSDIVRVYV